MDPLQIFKPGKHTASDGRVLEFTAAQLAACAAAYDPQLHEAPIVVGHPKSDLPAYGWAKALAFSDGTLNVEPHQVDAQFAELVNAGRFKKISASFYLPDAPENPKPGALYLRHIGFLGAQAPSVRGLKSASFSGSGEGVVEFMDWSKQDIATVLRSIRDFFIEQFGLDKADKAIPSFYVDSIQAEAVRSAEASSSPAGMDVAYSERNDVDPKAKEELERREREVKAKEDQLARERTEFAEREKTLNAEKAAAARAKSVGEAKTFIERLVVTGQVLPAQAVGLAAFMAALPSEGVVEFGEGDKAVKKPSRTWLEEYLKAQPKVVDYAERGAAGHDAGGGSGDPLAQAGELSSKAVEFMESEKKAGRDINIAQAVAHVKSKQAS